jgi:Skp family chaperone for outer membrane proteins
MKAVTLAGALALVLFTVPVLHAQQTPPPAQQKPPAQQPPAQKPAQPAPAQPAQPPRPFPEGAKMAYIDVQAIANQSREGQAATKKVQDLEQKKLAELNEKNKALQTVQAKLNQGGNVLSDEARAQATKEADRLQVDIQRMQQDAQAEVDELRNTLQREFQRKLMPVIQQLATEKALHFLFSADAGIVWADTGLDLTAEVIKRFDAAPVKPPQPSSGPAPQPR